MNYSHIVFLDRGTLPVAMRAPALPLLWREHESTTPERVVECLEHAEVAITNKVPLMASSLEPGSVPNISHCSAMH